MPQKQSEHKTYRQGVEDWLNRINAAGRSQYPIQALDQVERSYKIQSGGGRTEKRAAKRRGRRR